MTTVDSLGRVECESFDLVLNLLGVTMVIEGIEPIGLLEYYLVIMSTVNCQFYLSADFEIPIPDHVPIIQSDPPSGDCNDQRDGANLSSQMSFSRVKHGLGLFPKEQSATSGYDERVNSIE